MSAIEIAVVTIFYSLGALLTKPSLSTETINEGKSDNPVSIVVAFWKLNIKIPPGKRKNKAMRCM